MLTMLIYLIEYSGGHQIVGNICNGSESRPWTEEQPIIVNSLNLKNKDTKPLSSSETTNGLALLLSALDKIVHEYMHI